MLRFLIGRETINNLVGVGIDDINGVADTIGDVEARQGNPGQPGSACPSVFRNRCRSDQSTGGMPGSGSSRARGDVGDGVLSAGD